MLSLFHLLVFTLLSEKWKLSLKGRIIKVV